MNNAQIQQGVHMILEGLQVDLKDPNFKDTPHRFAKAMEEMFVQPSSSITAFEESYTDFVLVRGHEMWTLCPHHLLPVRMLVSVAYVPKGAVLGLSKLPRIMQSANRGPIMQERFTYDVREGLKGALGKNTSICVFVEGWHDCMRLRGVKSQASTITMATGGVFDDDKSFLDRVLLMIGRGR